MTRISILSLLMLTASCGGSSKDLPADQAASTPTSEPAPAKPVVVQPPALPAFASIAEAESRLLSAQAGHVWNNIVILDVATNEVVASVGTKEGALGAADVSYRPGSVTKAFTVAAALAVSNITEADTFDGKGGKWRVDGKQTINDGTAHGAMNVLDILATSSNIGTGQIALTLDRAKVQTFWDKLGFDTKQPTLTKMSDGEFAAYAAGAGTSLLVNAAGVAKSFAAVVSPSTTLLDASKAAILRKWLHAPIDGKDATGTQAAVPGMDVIGKTGTARGDKAGHSIGHFVGAFPGDAPRYVIVVAIETSADGYTGGTLAAPSFARIAKQLAPER